METEGLLAACANASNTAGAPAAPFARRRLAPTKPGRASIRPAEPASHKARSGPIRPAEPASHKARPGLPQGPVSRQAPGRATPPIVGARFIGRMAPQAPWRISLISNNRREAFGLHSPGRAGLPLGPVSRQAPGRATPPIVGARFIGRMAPQAPWRISLISNNRREAFGLHSPGGAWLPQNQVGPHSPGRAGLPQGPVSRQAPGRATPPIVGARFIGRMAPQAPWRISLISNNRREAFGLHSPGGAGLPHGPVSRQAPGRATPPIGGARLIGRMAPQPPWRISLISNNRREAFGLHSPGGAWLPQNQAGPHSPGRAGLPQGPVSRQAPGRATPPIVGARFIGRMAPQAPWRISLISNNRREAFGLHSPGGAWLPQSPVGPHSPGRAGLPQSQAGPPTHSGQLFILKCRMRTPVAASQAK